jgi:arginine deiminase
MAVSVSDRGSAVPSCIGEVRSEVGTLRRVLVHRPGGELDRLTPANAAELLFDDVIWPELAAEEHDALVETLSGVGVEVLHLDDLLAGVLHAPAAKADLVEAACSGLEPARRQRLEQWLLGLDAERLGPVLVAGATAAEAGLPGPGFAVAPLVNQMFVRDTSAWLGRELVLGAASNPIRARETCGLETIYRHHPLFSQSPGCREPIVVPGVEGGDLMCLSDRSALIGIGSRTTAEGATWLARALFERGFERVLGVPIPAARSCIHLDCLMTVVDRDAVLIDRSLLEQPVVDFRRGRGELEPRPGASLPHALAAAMEVEDLRLVEVANEREQWALGANTLALAPGRVIAFRRNVATNAALEAAGIEVLPIPGEELSRGRGGPRCLTCPITRDPVGGG